MITVTDTEAPTLWEIPLDVTVECNAIPALPTELQMASNTQFHGMWTI